VELFTIEEINVMLDEIAEELPEEVFHNLNGGVNLLPDEKRSRNDPDGGLYTLGDYNRNQMGRYINIYYGSLIAICGNASYDVMRKRVRDVLTHELTHHLESQAGDRSLEIEDKRNLHNYFVRKNKRKTRE